MQYTIPDGLGPTATDFLTRHAVYLDGLTVEERRQHIYSWLPAIKRPSKAINAFEQTIAVTTFLSWLDQEVEQ